MTDMKISIHKVNPLKRKMIPTDPKTLGFGRHFTDHVFMAEFERENGWFNTRIEPYRALQLDPASMCLHYGQEIFEGLKAYRGKDDGVYLFRWVKNAQRFQASARRLMMEPVPLEFFGKAIKTLVMLDQEWIPRAENCSLYIRPTLIATDPFLGVRPANEYGFFVICCPVGAYYPQGFNPVKILVSEEDVRAVRGGLGEAKTAANYAHSLRAQVNAQSRGYTQVLWLDAIERRWVEEVGTSNVFFKIKGEVVTPPLGGTILPGVTRDSVIMILKHWKVPVVERMITIQEVIDAAHAGDLEEAFGTGTAAVISPIGTFGWRNEDVAVNGGKTGELARQLYAWLTRLQYGYEEDPFGWVERIDLTTKV